LPTKRQARHKMLPNAFCVENGVKRCYRDRTDTPKPGSKILKELSEIRASKGKCCSNILRRNGNPFRYKNSKMPCQISELELRRHFRVVRIYLSNCGVQRPKKVNSVSVLSTQLISVMICLLHESCLFCYPYSHSDSTSLRVTIPPTRGSPVPCLCRGL
jgi:hypothetical protein